MRKTKTQRDYHKQMSDLNRTKKSSDGTNIPVYKPYKRKFTQSRLFYYGIRILIILVIMTLVTRIDTFMYALFDSL